MGLTDQRSFSTLEYAHKYQKLGFSVIPIIKGTKRPSVKWLRYQTVPADEAQAKKWFESAEDRLSLAIVTGKVSGVIELDIDGEAAQTYFENEVGKIQNSEIADKVKGTMKIKTANGNLNYIFAIDPSDSPDERIKTTVLWRGKQAHNEISLKADGAYAVAPPSEDFKGRRYEFINGILAPARLSKQELIELIEVLKQQKRKGATSQTYQADGTTISQIVSAIKPYYRIGLRNDFVMCLAGWFKKEGVIISDARRIIKGIYNEDEEKVARLKTLEETYNKHDLRRVKGYSGLLAILASELGEKREARNLLDKLQKLLPRYSRRSDEEGKTSLVEEASKGIMLKHNFMTIEESRETWFYRDGVYIPGGEILIEKEAEKMYRYKLQNRHLSEIKGHIMRNTYRKREEIDSDLDIINLRNGLYNFRTGEFSPHSSDYLSINQIPIIYDPQAKPHLFGKFLSEVLYPSEIRTAIELMAYTFYRDNPFELIAILFGYGANGKGVFTGLLTALHGAKNISNVSLASMLDDKYALSDLEGKAVNIDTELTSATIHDLSVLKKLTGKQPTRIQRKNQRAYDTHLYAKLWFSANKIPIISDDSDAYFRRKVILGFPNKFEGSKDDPDLLKKLATDEELSGMFNVLMIALRRLLNNNRIFTKDRTIDERRERYLLAVNPIEAFLKDAIAEDSIESDSVPKEDFYQAYKQFCNIYSLAVLSKESLGKTLKKAHEFDEGREASGDRRTVWKGMKLAMKYNVDPRQQILNV